MQRKTNKQHTITSVETHEPYVSDSLFFTCRTRLKMLATLAIDSPDWLRKDDDMFNGFVNVLSDLGDMLELAIDKANAEVAQLLAERKAAGQQP